MNKPEVAPRIWDALADLCPQLAAEQNITTQYFRGDRWLVVGDDRSGRNYRLAADFEFLLAPPDNATPLSRLVHSNESLDRASAEDEIAATVIELYRAGIIDLSPATAIPEALLSLRRGQSPSRRWSMLALRLPLYDPEPLLRRCEPHLGLFFNRLALLATVVWLLYTAPLAAQHGSALIGDLRSQLALEHTLWLFPVVYIVLKLAHELAHALAVKCCGGEVHELGIMFLVFFPVPYCDASASAQFSNKYDRMGVAAVGVATELLLASFGLVMWINSEPGMLRSAAYAFVMIGGFSTLLFNGNPLMRFDAYYVLADALEIPNLYARSRLYLASLLLRAVGFPERRRSAAVHRSERKLLLLYGIASMLYRTVILFSIAIYLAGKFFFLGIALAVWVVVAQSIFPIMRFVLSLATDQHLKPWQRIKTIVRCAVLVGVLGLAFFTVPLPHATVATGIVTLNDSAFVRPGVDGFIAEVRKHEGAQVSTGEVLLQLSNDQLHKDLRVKQARTHALSAELDANRRSDRATARLIEETLRGALDDAAEATHQIERLAITSPSDGRFVALERHLEPGRFLRRGDALGYISDPAGYIVRVVVTEANLEQLQGDVTAVSIRILETPNGEVPGQIIRETPASVDTLPSPALAQYAGGDIAIDPAAGMQLVPLEKVFQLDIKPLTHLHDVRAQGRARVRFEHSATPLSARLWRVLRRTFLAKFAA